MPIEVSVENFTFQSFLYNIFHKTTDINSSCYLQHWMFSIIEKNMSTKCVNTAPGKSSARILFFFFCQDRPELECAKRYYSFWYKCPNVLSYTFASSNIAVQALKEFHKYRKKKYKEITEYTVLYMALRRLTESYVASQVTANKDTYSCWHANIK